MNPNEWTAAIRELEDQRNIGFSRAANAAVREAKLAAENAELKARVEVLENERGAANENAALKARVAELEAEVSTTLRTMRLASRKDGQAA